jgi:radical SAM superfamily enzyme YgiQ (UPF0313 family)
MKNVILIEPIQSGVHVFQRFTLPRLGLPLLGALAKRELDITPRIYFEQYNRLDWKAISQADLVGISAITPTATDAYRVLEKVKQLGDIPVVMGGPHVTFLTDEALGKGADYVVRGEGEETFIDLLRHLGGDGVSLDGIAGLSYREDGTFLHNPDRPRIDDLSSLPWPDLTLIEGHERIKTIPIMTSRGCPHRCNFCSVTSIFGHKYRFRDTEDVIAELQHYQCTHPKDSVFFYDDNFTANAAHTKEMLREMQRLDIPRRWSAQTRVDIARDPELMNLMQETHCTYLYLGLESVNPATLEVFNKSQTVEDISEAVRVIHEHKISVHGMFVLGSDEDDVKSLKETVKFAKKAHIDTVQFLALIPLPGTEVYQEMKEQDRILSYDWEKYDGHHVVFQPARMAQYALQKRGPNESMLSFYSFWEATKLGLRFKWRSMVIRIFANRAIKRWKADNAEWLHDLKHRYKRKRKDLKADLKLRYRQLKKDFKAEKEGGYIHSRSHPSKSA